VMLTRPARPVASRMEMRIGSMCRPLVIWDVENLLRVAALACDARCTNVQLRFSAKSAAARYGFRGPIESGMRAQA
jgi:hypothetical protein